VENPLLDRIVNAFPKKFFLHFIERQQSLYQQTIDMAFSESWQRPESFAALPMVRRNLWEAETRKNGIANSLRCFDMPHMGDNSSCVTIKASGLILTAHYVDGPHQFVRDAESRKQNAGVNGWMGEHTDERLLTSPLPKLGKHPIYMNLLHGGLFPQLKTDEGQDLSIDESTCFLRVAIPDKNSDKYLYNWSVQEILLAYTRVPVNTTVEDKAHPRKKTAKRIEVKVGE
jgi:hypothetical protein